MWAVKDLLTSWLGVKVFRKENHRGGLFQVLEKY
jgi:hypothetical protein